MCGFVGHGVCGSDGTSAGACWPNCWPSWPNEACTACGSICASATGRQSLPCLGAGGSYHSFTVARNDGNLVHVQRSPSSRRKRNYITFVHCAVSSESSLPTLRGAWSSVRIFRKEWRRHRRTACVCVCVQRDGSMTRVYPPRKSPYFFCF